MEVKTRILGMTTAELQERILELGMPKFTAKQISQWVYQKGATTFDEMTNISKKHRELLDAHFVVGRMPATDKQTSKDGTVKYLFPTEDGQSVETVYIPENDRATLCVSSQVGCKMNCLFCQTGKQGFQGNLTAADILNQIYSIDRPDSLTNIVFMGQGEPLDNYDNVMKAIGLLTSEEGWAWSPRRITVSTVGLKKNLKRFVEESECHLAVSMHFPFHETRSQFMPAERQYGIEEIVELLSQYDWSHQRRLSFEYTMFEGVNDSMIFAKEIVRLLKNLDCRVNLIRYHRIPNVELNDTPMPKMTAFRDYLTKHDVYTTIRTSRGQDIEAACGMLITKE
ncbi:MAG: 23S rRNA (adenine(2503)-C(2))-methyltransferase RlmN [Bacteroidaceae bacterium]|nr:23S rRNA (adenine(2503)-C(2))-methyltransferase RlmN [Bacteroidaceae bacterium]MCR4835699.1 23S rRNA (adenine(2503)-C(2))-methyltransferase RlmN [Bacteroidaceae bacterium]